jgi:dTMP kinase
MAFIAFDGLDGSGKSTQLDLLATRLRSRGHEPLVLNHPEREGLGGWIRKLLHVDKQRFDTWAETFLYAADLAQVSTTKIRAAVKSGQWVLAHRWWYSSCVYQAGLDGADWDDVRDISLKAAGDFNPDVGLIVLADPEVAMARIAARTEDSVSPYENLPNLQQAHAGFRRVLGDGRVEEPLFLLDTTSVTPEETHAEVLHILSAMGMKLP